MTGAFRRVGREPLLQASFFEVVRDTIVSPDGAEFSRDVIVHPGAVVVVARVEGDVLMVRQYRAAVGDELLELPAGKLDAGESPAACAARELAEETGFRPRQLTALASYYCLPGMSDHVMHVFLAEDLEPVERAPQGHEEEHMQLVRLPFADAVAMAASGELRDGKSIVGLLLAARPG